MASDRKEIAIIGGGIAGLTLSIALKSEAFQCSIFEKKEEIGEVGAAISVFPNALSVLDELGMLQEILAVAGELRTIHLKTWKGRDLSRTSPKGEYPIICMHRSDLHRILKARSKATIHAGRVLRTMETLPDGRTELLFEDGSAHIADVVVGADGLHSVVRQQVIGDGSPIHRGYNIWRGICRSDFAIGHGSETFGRGQRVGIVPIRDGWYGWWASANEAYMATDGEEGARNKLIRLFGDWHHPIPELIAGTEVILKNACMDRKLVRGWSKGNVVLVGDAAHPTTPNLGQGGCTAIEGAWLLARCLTVHGASEEAFQRYEALHYPRAAKIIADSRQLGVMGQLENPLATGLRNLAFSLMPSSVSVKMVSKYFEHRVTKLPV